MDVSYRLSLVPFYRAGAKIGLKDFQVKPVTKTLQVSISFLSKSFLRFSNRNYLELFVLLCKKISQKLDSVAKKKRYLIKNNNKIYELFSTLSREKSSINTVNISVYKFIRLLKINKIDYNLYLPDHLSFLLSLV